MKRKTTLDAVDLKTLSQFILLGDPSLRPVQPLKPAVEGDAKAALTERRREARRAAHVLEQSIYVPEPIPGSARSSELESRLREIGERHGLPPTATISSFAGVWQGSGAMPKVFEPPPRQHLLHAERDPEAPVCTDVIVIVHEQAGTIVSVDEVEAR
ncbi:hypothetical protein ACFQ1I_40780 [Kitasatospora arboriphila]